MAKTVTLKQEINGVEHTIYPQTVPSQVVDPETGRSMEELWNLDHQMYEVVPSLPLTNIQEGKLYLVQTSTPGTYTQYVWNGAAWTNLGNAAINVTVEDTLNSGSKTTGLSANQGRELNFKITGKKVVKANEGWEHYKDGYLLKATNDEVGDALDSVGTMAQEGRVNVRIPLDGIKSAAFYQFTSSTGYGNLIVDANDVVLAAYTRTTGENISVPIPEGAAYLIFSLSASSYNTTTVTLFGEGLNSSKDGQAVSAAASGMIPKMVQGTTNEDGSINEVATYVTTEPIFGPHNIQLNPGYEFAAADLVDRQGNTVAYRFFTSYFYSPTREVTRNFCTTAKWLPDYGLRYMFRNIPAGTPISPNESIIKHYYNLTDMGLHREIPQDIPNYEIALNRINVLQHLTWVALKKVPERGNGNTYFHKAGQLSVGVPYSQPEQFRKFIPNDVSVRTFLTAAHNKRSLLYTEYIATSGRHSEYGITYYGDSFRAAYFGAVCSSYVDYVIGRKLLTRAASFPNIPGVSQKTTPTVATINTVKPLDFTRESGHVTVISEVWKDDFGNTKFICLCEDTVPYSYNSLYTPEQFVARLQATGEKLYEYSGWENIEDVDDVTKSLVQLKKGDCKVEPFYNDDICTFAGDYATFCSDDKIYLNARRAEIYTGVTLYKDGDTTPIDTIDITGLAEDGIYNDGEDWVKVNLTGMLSAGKYEARLTDGTNETAGTFFEVIEATLSAVNNGNSITATFSATGGTPIVIMRVSNDGTSSGEKEFTATEIENGVANFGFGYDSRMPYLRILIQGDYGTALKVIDYPQPSE